MRSDTGLGQTYKSSMLRSAGSPFVFIKRKAKKRNVHEDDLQEKAQTPHKAPHNASSGVDIKV